MDHIQTVSETDGVAEEIVEIDQEIIESGEEIMEYHETTVGKIVERN